MQEQEKEFWYLYDQYIQSKNKTLRTDLSRLLRVLEKKDRRTQILRPEKNWDRILGWQVLRNQPFIFGENSMLYLYEGEIIVWSPHWDRDIFLTRVPIYEAVSGRFVKPGYKLTLEDKGDATDYEWNGHILRYGLADESGLYLPIFDIDTVMKLCDKEIELIRPSIKESIIRNLHVDSDTVRNL